MSRQTVLEELTRHNSLIAPSMLKCDFGNLHREVALLETAGVQMLHLDVMDGNFVPNLSYGPMVIERLRQLTDVPFDAHLMISHPERYLDSYLQAGCDCITFHFEAVANRSEPIDPEKLLRRIRDADAIAGLAINPSTPVDLIEQYLGECDLVLIMSVEPGFGGQVFLPESLDKLRRVAQLVSPDTLVSIDGGVEPSTIGCAAVAGANVFVVGSVIFDAPDYDLAINKLRELVLSSHAHPQSQATVHRHMTAGRSHHD